MLLLVLLLLLCFFSVLPKQCHYPLLRGVRVAINWMLTCVLVCTDHCFDASIYWVINIDSVVVTAKTPVHWTKSDGPKKKKKHE